MDKKLLLAQLKKQFRDKTKFTESGPSTDEGRDWLTTTEALLKQYDANKASQFRYLMQYLFLRLSSYTVGPIWNNMLSILQGTIAELEVSLPKTDEKIYGPGDQYSVYKDLKEIIGNAEKEVFIMDSYANEEIFDLYLDKVKTSVQIRFLTKSPSRNLGAVIAKFKAKPGVKFEAKIDNNIHDRVIFIDDNQCWVIGHSIKDAAMKKPTYLLPVDSVVDMKSMYEKIWNSATSI